MILIGCPVYNRDWILPLWFDRIKNQDIPLSELGFVFVVSSHDKDTLNALFRFQAENPGLAHFDVVYEDGVTHEKHREDTEAMYHRTWSQETSLRRMVLLRNTLLGAVRDIQPELFFSLDSDILLEDPATISKLAQIVRDNPRSAVSPLAYMSHTRLHPSFMIHKPLIQSDKKVFVRLRDWPRDSIFEVDVIMAAKMMSPDAYNTPYAYHKQGEDIGWSMACTERDITLYLDSRTYSCHLLSRKMLDLYLAFGDGRAPK